jgi:hypothetical protein
MSKVDEIRGRYNKITSVTFNKFVNADTTPTKKYLEYMCKTWTDKINYSLSLPVNKLITAINEFDQLLPYIENKDIYSLEFRNFDNLLKVTKEAKEIKLDKNFNREEHIDILIENDEFLLLHPKTFEGSLKYGANTKWCTASKSNKYFFDSHTKGYILVYLVRKNLSVKNNYEKIAFRMDKSDSPLTMSIISWNQNDTEIEDKIIINSGWGYDRLLEITFAIRVFAIKERRINDAKNNLNRITEFMSTFNIDDFQTDLNILSKTDDSVISKTNEVLEIFNKKMEEFLK